VEKRKKLKMKINAQKYRQTVRGVRPEEEEEEEEGYGGKDLWKMKVLSTE